MKLKLTGDEAQSIVYEDHKDWELIEVKTTDTDRWSTEMQSICKHIPTDKYYSFNYRQGSTEMQSESPYEYDDEVEVIEVERKKVLVEQWVVKTQSEEA